MKQISILGCGWLGFPLAEECIKIGYKVKGTTTSQDKLATLSKAGIIPFLTEISSEGIRGDAASFLSGSEILIINIPPKIKDSSSESYVQKLRYLVSPIQDSTVEKVLFISSTSVYEDRVGFPLYTEKDARYSNSYSAMEILKAEKMFSLNSNLKTTIVRFGGLIGEKRHPVNFLSGKTDIKNPEAPINLIHLVDCISVIRTILENNIWGECFNAVYPSHLKRKDYYEQKAVERNLSLPLFDFEKTNIGKIISSEYLIESLNFKFKKRI